MIGDLRGSTALVTGGGTLGGMGGTIAAVLAEQGATVAVTDLDLDGAREVAGAIGGETIALHLDASSPESINQAVAEAIAQLGRVDILVNNAGVLGDSGDDAWETTFRINVLGTVRCSEAVLPRMKERRHGKIVNIASIAGHAARGTAGAYGASKAAVLRYTKGLAVEVAPYSINVNAVCPGAVWTGMQSGPFERPEEVDERLAGLEPYEAFLEYYRPLTPLQRPQTAEEIGKAVAYLASEDARNVTGQCLHVDGGTIRS